LCSRSVQIQWLWSDESLCNIVTQSTRVNCVVWLSLPNLAKQMDLCVFCEVGTEFLNII
jgi:hypothetical protein